MSNLIDIQAQIDRLQKQAAEIKAKEFDKTVKEILAKMQAFGITLKDLQQGMGKTRKALRGKAKAATSKRVVRTIAKEAGAKVAAKYFGPNGETWSGRGLMPRWLAALVKQGRKKEDFAVKG